MIGCGSMGGGMALLFAEIGLHVSLSDPSDEAMDTVITKAEKSGYHGQVNKFKGGLWTRRILFVLSTHFQQTTTLSASPFRHRDSWYFLFHMAASATRSSKASCLTCPAMT
jgi:hypothetical protein